MPFTYIVDSDPTQQANADTFATLDLAKQHIFDTHGVYLTTGGDAGLVTIAIRCSSGVSHSVNTEFNNFAPNGSPNAIEIVGQFSNGFPAVLVHDSASGGTLLSINDDNIVLYGAAEDSLILKGSATNAVNGFLLNTAKPTTVGNLVLDGLGVAHYCGINGSGATTATDVKIVGCNQEFYGAARNANLTLNHCTITDCALIRQHAAITNSLLVNIGDWTKGDGLVAGSDYNAYDVAKVGLKYKTGVTPASEDINSIFSLDKLANISADAVGGYDVTASSILINADSTGIANIGANVDILVSDPPVSGDSTITVDYNSTQVVDLAAHVTDDNNSIDWDSLIISQQPAHGSSSVVGSVVTVDYTGTGYDGADEFHYLISDTDGISSDAGIIGITVYPLPVTAVLVEAGITKGQLFTLTMTAYVAGEGIGHVRVFLKNITGDGAEYECEIVTNVNAEITCKSPLDMPSFAGGQILIKPIISF